MDCILSHFSIEELSLLAAVLVFFLLELYYWLFVFGRVGLRKLRLQSMTEQQAPVSIIIAVRNEYEALQKNLSLILEQDYPEFEVIVVNDCSEDDTEILLATMQQKYPNLILRAIEKNGSTRHNKKMALGIGIKAARYELVLFTDADCYPSGSQWLRMMQRYFTDKKELVLGYTKLTDTPKWIRADYFMQSLHYLGKALRGKAYMGLNSNLAYRRDLFFDNKGFDLRVTENLREDIVLVNKIATRKNTGVALGAGSTTISTLRYSSEKWKRRRIKELHSLDITGRGPHYPALTEAIVRLLFFTILAISALVFVTNNIVLLSLLFVFVMRFVLQIIVWKRSQKRLGERRLIPMLWIWDFVSPIYYIYLIFSAKIKRTPKTW